MHSICRKEDWLGLPYYAPDEVPVYSRGAHVEESLFSAVRAGLHSFSLKSDANRTGASGVSCASLFLEWSIIIKDGFIAVTQ